MNPGQNGKRISNGSPDEPRCYVIMGVSGCGKSEIGARLASQLGYRHLEGDSFHPPRNIEKMAAGIALDDADRKEWLLTLSSEIASARALRQGLVISCSALKRKYRDLLRQGDPSLMFIHLSGDRSLIEERMRARPNHFMPVSLLDSQFRDLEPLDSSESGLQLDVRLPPDELIRRVVEGTSGKHSENVVLRSTE
ncbi:MAG TPA: gluconokinase [Noviherbaspirillum sp.]|nr:gluconokinase [Noviherbaspirillum sp.]